MFFVLFLSYPYSEYIKNCIMYIPNKIIYAYIWINKYFDFLHVWLWGNILMKNFLSFCHCTYYLKNCTILLRGLGQTRYYEALKSMPVCICDRFCHSRSIYFMENFMENGMHKSEWTLWFLYTSFHSMFAWSIRLGTDLTMIVIGKLSCLSG